MEALGYTSGSLNQVAFGHEAPSPLTMTLLVTFSFSPTVAGKYVVSHDALGNALVFDADGFIETTPIGIPGFIAKIHVEVPLFLTGVSGVPELSTWAMMLIGFAGIGFVAYRRTKKRSAAIAAA